MPRTTCTPGVSLGTRIWLCWRCRSATGSVLPITMKTAQLGSIAPDDHHLRPLTTYSSPSRSLQVAMFVASDDATSVSVMQNADLISPTNNNKNHHTNCSSE